MAAPRTSYARSHFTTGDDLCILREVLGTNPFQDARLWPQVAKNLAEATGKTFSLRSIRNRCELLMAQFLHKDTANLKKSGTEEQYAEKEQLLTEILALAKEFGYVIRGTTLKKVVARMQPDVPPGTPTDRRAANFERLAAAQTRDTAAAAHCTQVAEEDGMEDFQPTEASQILNSIYSGNYVDVTPPSTPSVVIYTNPSSPQGDATSPLPQDSEPQPPAVSLPNGTESPGPQSNPDTRCLTQGGTRIAVPPLNAHPSNHMHARSSTQQRKRGHLYDVIQNNLMLQQTVIWSRVHN
ncbi:uncharacterized protein LOC142574882 [Dermacentor variabilis]|uniref:uncharacterized protein LOC142574882 n=1 Tax=Dermacentor variabilis TaxID=34621 RepID=UPI003F5B1581